MPELPEVETARRGVAPHILGRTIQRVIVRQSGLRWPVPPDLSRRLEGRQVEGVRRRGKYLLFDTGAGELIVHLGMSGSLRVVDSQLAAGRHDHVDLVMDDGRALRLCDPRRFGAVLFSEVAEAHPLLRDLGPEPLGADFSGELLYRRSRGRRAPVKAFIMDSHTVVGVGNIYASEALFTAGIRPDRAAGRISLARYRLLAEAITRVLARAIDCGGTTLRDFVGGDGKPGYFRIELEVYGRGGLGCTVCGTILSETRVGQRGTVFCRRCQR